MDKPVILLIEDDNSLRMNWKKSLENSGFDVLDIVDGNNLESILRGFKVDVILSDSDSEFSVKKGYQACYEVIEKKLIDNSVLIIGMSGYSENQSDWRGIANFNGFYNKLNFEHLDVGKTMMRCWKNFEEVRGPYREKMPLVSGLEEE